MSDVYISIAVFMLAFGMLLLLAMWALLALAVWSHVSGELGPHDQEVP